MWSVANNQEYANVDAVADGVPYEISNQQGRCLGWSETVVKMRNCRNASWHQLWMYSAGSRILSASGRCLDNGGSFPHIWDCRQDLISNQQWTYDASSGQLKKLSALDFCLEAASDTSVVTMNYCDTLNGYQRWVMPPRSTTITSTAIASSAITSTMTITSTSITSTTTTSAAITSTGGSSTSSTTTTSSSTTTTS